jgi:hypothetical protein
MLELSAVVLDGERELPLVLTCERYPIKLRTSFGTSHSSTSERTNVLVAIKIGDIQGRLSLH